MYALVEIAAQPTPTLPAGAVMEVWAADAYHKECTRIADGIFRHELKAAGLQEGSYLVRVQASGDVVDIEDPIVSIIEWTIPGKPTRRFRIQQLPY